MTEPTTHWKLGLFVLIGIVVGLFVIVYFGGQAFRREAITYTSYLDETVTGLEVGSPVSFRGVTIGNVSAIDVAPDRRHVQVTYELKSEVLGRLGLLSQKDGETWVKLPPDLRVQLATIGVTGAKYLKIDFFPAATPPELPFATPENTIPATPSTLKNLEDAVTRTLDRLPDIADDLSSVLVSMRDLLREVDQQQLPERASRVLVEAERLVRDAQSKVQQIKAREISKETRASLASLNETLSKAQGVLDRIAQDQGLLSSLQRTSDSIGDVILDARGVGTGLDGTLRDLRQMARAVGRLADALERDPDMLLKGRSVRE